jgi:hypothetical protein
VNSSSAARVLFLLFVPIVTAELLTGSTPLYTFFYPTTLLLLLGLYGAGALLIRELGLIWNKGWPTVLLLGAAYGVVEEGLDVKSWFNPNFSGLGVLGTYGRYAGVNLVWAAELTVFHAVFSIAIPIALTGMVFPDAKRTRWLGGKKLWAVSAVFVLDVTLGLLLWPYLPPVPQYLGALGLVGLLVWVAHRLPRSLSDADEPSRARGRLLAGVGFLFVSAFFFVVWVLPSLGLPALADISLILLLAWGAARFLMTHKFTDAQVFALISGATGFLVFISVVTISIATGSFFVAIAYALGLAFFGNALRDRERRETGAR